MATKSRSASERFVDAVKAGIEKLAAELNVPLAKAMGLTKAYFLEKGKVQAEVTKEAFEAAYAEIVAMNTAQNKAKVADASSDNGRLPLTAGTNPAIRNPAGQTDDAQNEWDRGRDSRWFKAFSIANVRARFAGKIKAGEEITEADLDVLKGEKEAEKAKIAELVGARDDGAKEDCGSPAHPDNAPKAFQPLAKFRIERTADGTWKQKHHAQGNDVIEYGNVLVVDGQMVFYDDGCRQAAWDVIANANTELAEREPKLRAAIATEQDLVKKASLQEELDKLTELANTRLTFYSRTGAARKIAAIKKAVQKGSDLKSQLVAAGGRSGGSRYQGGPRENKVDRAVGSGWRTSTRGGR